MVLTEQGILDIEIKSGLCEEIIELSGRIPCAVSDVAKLTVKLDPMMEWGLGILPRNLLIKRGSEYAEILSRGIRGGTALQKLCEGILYARLLSNKDAASLGFVAKICNTDNSVFSTNHNKVVVVNCTAGMNDGRIILKINTSYPKESNRNEIREDIETICEKHGFKFINVSNNPVC